ncbi:MAG: PD40 domain-containing protein [Acidobacteria bacterium]|nr:PD40 domain-containing protein [Acidobacteriota bacterium]
MLFFLCCNVLVQDTWLPHLTRPGGGFRTDLILANPSAQPQGITLDAFDANGQMVKTYVLSLSPNETRFLSAATVLGDQAASLRYALSQIKVTAAYESVNPPSSPAHVSPSVASAKRWLLYPGNWEVVFDGIAAVNLGTQATDIHVNMLGLTGEVLQTEVIASALAPRGKTLFVLGAPGVSLFNPPGQVHFEIVSSENISLIALRGSPPGSSVGFLWQNAAFPTIEPDDATLVWAPPPGESAQNPVLGPDRKTVYCTLFHGGYNHGPAGIWSVTDATTILDDHDHDAVMLPGSSWNVPTQRIAFSWDLEDRDEIWTANPQGGDVFRVTRSTNGRAFEPSFSPDGLWLTYELRNLSDQGSIYKIAADGTGPTRLTDGFDDRQPNWSPDGSAIVFQRREQSGELWQIMVMDPSGSNLRSVQPSSRSQTDISWSPDGKYLVYSSSDEASIQLRVIAPSGGSPITVTNRTGRYDGAPAWSPDGRTLFFESAPSEPDELATSLFQVKAPNMLAASNSTNPRDQMRHFVKTIAQRARQHNYRFTIIPQNGLELVRGIDGATRIDYLAWIDGIAQEHLYYGQEDFDRPTPTGDTEYLTSFLETALAYGVRPLAAEYCQSQAFVTDVFARANALGFLAFAGSYDLDAVPTYPVNQANSLDIHNLRDAANFLYLITPDQYPDRSSYLSALRNSSHDIIILDAYHQGQVLTPQEVAMLKTKPQGGRRLVIAYMNIGAAENWRSYWQPNWAIGNPNWLVAAYEGYPDETWVRYWDPQWQTIILDQYLILLLDAGFDGAYLDNILAFEQFE